MLRLLSVTLWDAKSASTLVTFSAGPTSSFTRRTLPRSASIVTVTSRMRSPSWISPLRRRPCVTRRASRSSRCPSTVLPSLKVSPVRKKTSLSLSSRSPWITRAQPDCPTARTRSRLRSLTLLAQPRPVSPPSPLTALLPLSLGSRSLTRRMRPVRPSAAQTPVTGSLSPEK